MSPITKFFLVALLAAAVVATIKWKSIEKAAIRAEIRLGMLDANWKLSDSPEVKEVKDELYFSKVRNSPSLQQEIRWDVYLGRRTNDARFWNHSKQEAEEDAKFAKVQAEREAAESQEKQAAALVLQKNTEAAAREQEAAARKSAALAAIETEAAVNTAFNQGFASGKDAKQTGGDAPVKNIQNFAVFMIESEYPKLKSFPKLKDAYISGFVKGYNSAASYVSLHPQAAADLRSENEAKAGIGNSTTGIAKGKGSSRGDAYAAARQELPAGAVEISTVYDWPGNQSYFICKITYRTK